MKPHAKKKLRQYTVNLPDDAAAFVRRSTGVDSVSVAVRALIRKAMQEARK